MVGVKSLLDCPTPPLLPGNARLVHFGDNGRVVKGTDYSTVRKEYLEKQKQASARQTARRAKHVMVEQVVPFEEHLRSYFSLQLISEEERG